MPDDVVTPETAPPPRRHARPVVVVAGSLDGNEPIDAVVEAARLTPELDLRCTGALERLRPATRRAAPSNVTFTGWLAYPRFIDELQQADLVAAFSDDPEIMNRAAFEAVGCGRPLLLSDLPKLRSRFGGAALFSANQPAAIAAGMRQALKSAADLGARSRRLAESLRAEHARALSELRRLLEPTAHTEAEPRPRRRVLLLSAHPYPSHPLLRRNVDHLLRQGVEVDLVCTRDRRGEAALQQPGLRITALPVEHRRKRALSYLVEYAGFFLLALPVVSYLSLRRRPDVVQVDNLPDFLVFAAAVPRLLGSRLVLYIYDLFPEMTMTRLRTGAGHPAVRAARVLERLSARFAHHVITVSECFRSLLAARGVDPARVSVLYNSQPMPDGLTRVSPPSPVMITHASLVERYGIQVAVRALPHLLPSWPDLTYEVLGDGEQLAALRSLASELGVLDHVSFRGFRPWKETMERIARASIGVVPVVADGFGELILPMKLLEYAAVGIPIVCSRLPGIEEGFAADAVAYFPQGDAQALAAEVDRLLRSPAEAEAQVERARKALQRIAWETVGPKYLPALAPA
jgi:glycosyltransferase involved in cell wall biosynthesis